MARPPAANDFQHLERLLRRHGIEGEAAFHVLAARYLRALNDAPRRLFARLRDHAQRADSITRQDATLKAAMDALVACDPTGGRLADAYQHFIGRRFREGSGKFFTPPQVAMAMACLLPRVDRAVVMDPTCGGGSFLVAASVLWGETSCHLVGNDIESSLVDLTEITLALAAPAHHRRTLSEANLYEFGPSLKTWRGKVDYILANPPFSLPLETVGATSPLFKLGYHTSDAVFLDVCHALLRPGGRLVCLLPHSLIVNAEFQKLRAAVEERWRLRGVIALPEGIFHMAANTTTRADILILDKPASRDSSLRSKTIFASAATVGVQLNRRMKDDANALAEIIIRTDVADALGLNRCSR
ncbi:MAG: class I SAM-dependent DNA methyltransferase [Blastocatellia bacterium]